MDAIQSNEIGIIPKTRVPTNAVQNCQDLTRLTETAHNGFWEAVTALNEIRERKLYLSRLDDNGHPCFRTFKDFLKAEFNFGRSNFCRMQNAYQARKLLNEKYSASHPTLLQAMPENVDVYYEISKIPKEQLDEAMSDFAQDVDNDMAITAILVRQWRTSRQPQSRRTLPVMTVPHEVVEEEPSPVMTDTDITSKKDGNAVEAMQDKMKMDENLISGIPEPIKKSPVAQPTKAVQNDSPEVDSEDDTENGDIDKPDNDDADIIEKLRWISNYLQSTKVKEFVAKDSSNLDWLRRIFTEVNDSYEEYITIYCTDDN